MDEFFCCACLASSLESSKIVQLSEIMDIEQGLSYADCIRSCTNAELNEMYYICDCCISELKTSYTFCTKINRSQEILKQHESKLNSENETDQIVLIEVSKATAGQADESTEVEGLNFEYQFDDEDTAIVDSAVGNDSIEETNSLLDIIEATSGSEISGDEKTGIGSIDEEKPAHIVSERIELTQAEDQTISTSDENSIEEIEITPVNIELHEEGTSSINSIDKPTQKTGKNANSEKPRRRFFGKFCCDYCDKLFPNHSRMILHRRCHESDRPKFACNECGRIYATNQALEVHIRAVHELSGYPCKICSKVFPVKASLTIHMRFHTGNFPFVCETCGHKFAQLCHLNTHRNVKHNSVRFCCSHPNCGKLFTSSASLRNHEYSHGLMPFECEFCHRGYPSKSKLKVHVRRAHNKNLTLEELEPMRRFHVMRSKPNIMQVNVPSSDKTSPVN